MNRRSCVLAIAMAGLWLGGAQAAPFPGGSSFGEKGFGESNPAFERIQFLDFFDDDPPPPPPGYYYDPPPPGYWRPPHPHPYYPPPLPPGYRPQGYRPLPPPAYVGKEAMKDYVKARRQGQKEILKDQVRGWNRANGF